MANDDTTESTMKTVEIGAKYVYHNVMELTGFDRCDRCNAQAYAKVTTLSGKELMFCGHHLASHKPVLMETCQEIHDYTPALATTGMTSASV